MSALTRCALSSTSGSARRCCRSSTKRSCARLAAALPRPVGSTRTASRLPLPMCSALSRWRGRSRSTTSRSLQLPRCAKPRTAPRSPPRSKRFAGSRCGSSMAAKREGCRRRACSPASLMRMASSAISGAAATGWCGTMRHRRRRSARVSACRSGRCDSPNSAITARPSSSRSKRRSRPRRYCANAPAGRFISSAGRGARSRGSISSRPATRCTSFINTRSRDARRRLYRAACWLSDTAWTEHPDYRAELAFLRSLRMPVGAIEHSERAFIALAMHARYGGPTDDPVKAAALPLLDDDAAAEARSLGLALRLAYTLCGGALDLLDQVLLDAKSNTLVLELPASGGLFVGEAVQRRLDALGRALGLATRTERRLSPTPVLA